MSSIRFRAWILGLASGLAIAVGFSWIESLSGREDQRRQLLKIYDLVSVGAPVGEASQIVLANLGNASFYTRSDLQTARWYVSASSDLFQGQWVLIICIERESVTGMRFGVGDDVGVKPKEAPTDKGRCVAK